MEKKEEEIQIEEGIMIESPRKKLKNMMKLMIEIEKGRKEMIDTKEKKRVDHIVREIEEIGNHQQEVEEKKMLAELTVGEMMNILQVKNMKKLRIH